MSEMIERVARVLGETPYRDPSGAVDLKILARAAIEAMRDPTDDVAEIMSGHAANGYVDWRDLHSAMIDAALKSSSA